MHKSPSLEFVILIALMTAIIAFSIDSMLPALPLIAADLGASGNDRQLIVSSLFLGLAFGQLVYGPVSDTVGRRPAVIFGFALFLVGCVVSVFARDFNTMLVGRVLQGLGAAGPRIVSIAIVRDLYSGPAMAKVMSLAMTIFILVPVIAPSLGQALLLIGPWEGIFVAMSTLAAVTMVWFWARMPESLAAEHRPALSLARTAAAFTEAATNRVVFGASLAAAFIFSALIAYLSIAQQLFSETYGAGAWFPILFGSLAIFVGGSSLVNSQLVMRFGMRRLSWWALYVFVGAAAMFEVIAVTFHGVPPLAITVVWLAVTFSTLGLLFGNLNAIAMEPMGHIAGSAAALIGASTTLASAALGALIGRSYDGTVLPITLAFLLLGVAAMAGLALSGTASPSRQ